MKKYLKVFSAAALGMAPMGVMAQGETIPLDLTSTASTLVTWIGTSAGTAVGVFLTFLGIRYVIRAFRAVRA